MLTLLDIDDLTQDDIHRVWDAVRAGEKRQLDANIAWSFEGNGIRTRTTFVQAFQSLGARYVELPNFLKTGESAVDLAGYMDQFYALYVIRESNHQRLTEFARATTRPVINAMSSQAHPCEVLADAYSLYSRYPSLSDLRVLLWGPMTNVFRSWHALAQVLGLDMTHYCPAEGHSDSSHVAYTDNVSGRFDVVVTDAWPEGFSDTQYTLDNDALADLGSPLVIPTPPVTVGNELAVPLGDLDNFVGYAQKQLLLPVQTELVHYLLTRD